MGLFKEFKEFALRGNVIDLAVGVIIGAAFGKITTSLVNDVMMPPLGKCVDGREGGDFKDYIFRCSIPKRAAKLPAKYTLTDIQKANLPVFAYGSFFTTVIDFVILAFCVFLMIKLMNMAISGSNSCKSKKPPPRPRAAGRCQAADRDSRFAEGAK